MEEKTEEKINELGGKIDTVSSIMKALLSSFCGIEELTPNDTYNFIYLLEEKLKDLKNLHDEITDELAI